MHKACDFHGPYDRQVAQLVASQNPFSQWLEQAIERYGKSQSAIAGHTGLSRTSIHKYVTGAISPRRRNVQAIVDALLAGTPDQDIPAVRALLLDTGLTAAGLASSGPPAVQDPLDALLSDESLIEYAGYEAGFDDLKTPFTDEEKDQLRTGINDFIRAWAEEKRRPKD